MTFSVEISKEISVEKVYFINIQNIKREFSKKQSKRGFSAEISTEISVEISVENFLTL